MILKHLTPVLEEVGIPDFTQTAYQQGLSCIDAIFATQEALLMHVRDGGKPLLGLYDIEKAFNSIEIPILLEQIYSIGVNGKLWQLLNHWYSTTTARVRIESCISNDFPLSRGGTISSINA